MRRNIIDRFCSAWNFLTVIPFLFSGKAAPSAKEIGRSLIVFPLVGGVLGLLLAAAYRTFSAALPPAMVSLSVVFLSVLITGGLHLDGLADTIDGLQGKSREEALRIMKEGTIGAFGALGLIFVLGFKISSLSFLPPGEAVKAVWIMPVLGRSAFVMLLVHFPYGRAEGGLGAPFALHSRRSDSVWATVFTLLIAFLVASVWGIVAVTAALIVTWMAGCYFTRRFGGITGDMIGATGEVIEALTLVQWNIYQHFLLAK